MQFEDIKNTALMAATKAANLQKKYFSSGIPVEKKGAINLLTQVDLDSQSLIVECIRKRHPSHKILAEENQLGHQDRIEGPIWIIDPLDGTSNYSKSVPFFGISIAFMEENEVTLGVICQPILNEWFLGVRRQGAFFNGKPIRVSSTAKLDDAMLATGFPYDRRESPHTNLELFSQLEMKTLSVRRPGAAALDLAYTACGRFDGFWELKLGPWDIAAGIVLVEEAGGIISDYRGNGITNNLWCQEIVAANPKIHPNLVQETKKHSIHQ